MARWVPFDETIDRNREDIARVVVFLASEDAGWMTGERLTVAGGMS